MPEENSFSIGPNVIILGAPKSGTSSIYEYFKKHDEIFVPSNKEIHYFSDDLKSKNPYRRDLYYAMFANANRDTAVVDVAVLYMYSNVAVKRIKEELGNIKLICLLRNPVDAVHAFHSQMVFTGNEDVTDLEKAWKLQELRQSGMHLPDNMYQHPNLLQYQDIFKYGEQVERIFKYFPKENVHFIFFNNFTMDTAYEMKKLYEFIGVRDPGDLIYKKYNPSKKVRSRMLNRIIFDRQSVLRKVATGIITDRKIRLKLVNTIRRLNSVKAPRPPLISSMQQTIRNAYMEDIKKLENLLKVNLDDWKS